MSEWTYIIAAYAVSWTVVIAYGAYLALRERGARRLSARARGDST